MRVIVYGPCAGSDTVGSEGSDQRVRSVRPTHPIQGRTCRVPARFREAKSSRSPGRGKVDESGAVLRAKSRFVA